MNNDVQPDTMCFGTMAYGLQVRLRLIRYWIPSC